MGRRPIHLEMVGKLTPRERIWREIRRLCAESGRSGHRAGIPGRFTVMQIEDATRFEWRTIHGYLVGLQRAQPPYIRIVAGNSGHAIARREGGKFRAAVYELLRDVGIEAPRVNSRGMETTSGRVFAGLWRAMKVLRRFDWRELHASLPELGARMPLVSIRTIRGYCQALERAGYLHAEIPSRGYRPTVYRLAKDTGPRAPVIQRVKSLYDPNLGEIVWQRPEVDA